MQFFVVSLSLLFLLCIKAKRKKQHWKDKIVPQCSWLHCFWFVFKCHLWVWLSLSVIICQKSVWCFVCLMRLWQMPLSEKFEESIIDSTFVPVIWNSSVMSLHRGHWKHVAYLCMGMLFCTLLGDLCEENLMKSTKNNPHCFTMKGQDVLRQLLVPQASARPFWFCYKNDTFCLVPTERLLEAINDKWEFVLPSCLEKERKPGILHRNFVVIEDIEFAACLFQTASVCGEWNQSPP